MGSIQYHLKELEVGMNLNDDRRVLPDLLDSERVILDIGCGIGQSFIALNCIDRICIGVDVDEEAIAYGITHFGDEIQFIVADAGRIPMPPNTFNLVFSRVALPYTNIPKAIKEARRVLKKEGRIWMTLHSINKVKTDIRKAIVERQNIKRLVQLLYVLMNGHLLKYFGFVLPFINGEYESWQDASAIRRLLLRNGFEVKEYDVGKHAVIEGRLK